MLSSISGHRFPKPQPQSSASPSPSSPIAKTEHLPHKHAHARQSSKHPHSTTSETHHRSSGTHKTTDHGHSDGDGISSSKLLIYVLGAYLVYGMFTREDDLADIAAHGSRHAIHAFGHPAENGQGSSTNGNGRGHMSGLGYGVGLDSGMISGSGRDQDEDWRGGSGHTGGRLGEGVASLGDAIGHYAHVGKDILKDSASAVAAPASEKSYYALTYPSIHSIPFTDHSNVFLYIPARLLAYVIIYPLLFTVNSLSFAIRYISLTPFLLLWTTRYLLYPITQTISFIVGPFLIWPTRVIWGVSQLFYPLYMFLGGLTVIGASMGGVVAYLGKKMDRLLFRSTSASPSSTKKIQMDSRSLRRDRRHNRRSSNYSHSVDKPVPRSSFSNRPDVSALVDSDDLGDDFALDEATWVTALRDPVLRERFLRTWREQQPQGRYEPVRQDQGQNHRHRSSISSRSGLHHASHGRSTPADLSHARFPIASSLRNPNNSIPPTPYNISLANHQQQTRRVSRLTFVEPTFPLSPGETSSASDSSSTGPGISRGMDGDPSVPAVHLHFHSAGQSNGSGAKGRRTKSGTGRRNNRSHEAGIDAPSYPQAVGLRHRQRRLSQGEMVEEG